MLLLLLLVERVFECWHEARGGLVAPLSLSEERNLRCRKVVRQAGNGLVGQCCVEVEECCV